MAVYFPDRFTAKQIEELKLCKIGNNTETTTTVTAPDSITETATEPVTDNTVAADKKEEISTDNTSACSSTDTIPILEAECDTDTEHDVAAAETSLKRMNDQTDRDDNTAKKLKSECSD